MKLTVCLALAACGLGALCLAKSSSDRWPVREQDTIEKTLPLSGAPNRVVIENVDGYVHTTASAGQSVHITAHRTIRAETDADLAEGKRDVKLDISGKPGEVSVYYDAPWRCRDGGQPCSGERRRFYEVIYDIDVQIPRDARAVISTVNSGDIRLEGLSGSFDVKNVNGGISMNAIGGSGDAHTVNGPVAVHFAKNPSGACSFKSVNGSLDAFFPNELSADLLFKTLNGQVYTDFEVSPRAMPAEGGERRDGKFVYHSNRLSGGRAGRGGPELSFNTLNGSIRLHRQQ
ncbi:MAG: DUF4097 family beta strand repeat-containing protein [Bryobacteraceae bacterium]